MKMKWFFIFFVLYNASSVQARYDSTRINRIINLIQRRQNPILDVPEFPEELPEAEPVIPGHTLLRPARGMLKSAVKFPHRDYGNSAVYGNLGNLGITYGNTNERILYTDFRKANNLLTSLLNSIYTKERKRHSPVIVIEVDSKRAAIQRIHKIHIDKSDEEIDYRRRKGSKKTKFRDRSQQYTDSSDTSNENSESSDHEKNPGNPYTIHKNKYKQNWLWNHFMDGDHMNVNPYGPEMNVLGPSGADLFFGRKWWYFNQDDYKPIG